jgi:hypothetical protein
MSKKSFSIDFKYDYNFLLLGICSPLKSYSIAYHLNKALSTELQRSREDIQMGFSDGLEEAYFAQFEYLDIQFQNQWYLIANKCKIRCNDLDKNQGTIFDGFKQNRKKTKYLIPENPKVDFYIQIHGIYNEESKSSLIKNIKNIERIVSIHEIDTNKLRSKENLIVDE